MHPFTEMSEGKPCGGLNDEAVMCLEVWVPIDSFSVTEKYRTLHKHEAGT